MNIKTFFRFALVLPMLLIGISPIAAKLVKKEINGINYLLADDMTATVISSNPKYSGEIVIPEETTFKKRQYKVTLIGDSAFEGCSNLTNVLIPNSITTIGNFAFTNCSNLNSVTIPNSVTTIGQAAFANCSNLNVITLPNSVTIIGPYAFINCSKLTDVTIPNSVTIIGPATFAGCANLTNVTIPDSYIAPDAFDYCNKLNKETVEKLEAIISMESLEWSLKNENGKRIAIVTGYNEPLKNEEKWKLPVNIPDTISHNGEEYVVTKISERAFFNKTLLSITIPESVTEIEESAFSLCTIYEPVKLPSSLTKISDYLFSRSNIVSVEIPNSVTSIGQGAFENTSFLEAINIPESVKYIGSRAFQWSDYLKSVTINGVLEKIGERPFAFCKNLNSICFPNAEIAKANSPIYEELTYYNGNRTYNITLVNGQEIKASLSYADIPQSIERQYGKMHWVINQNGGRNLVNEKDKVVVNTSNYDKVFLEGNAIIVKKNGKYGALSYSGQILVSPKYDKYHGVGMEHRMFFSNNTPNGLTAYAISKTGAVLASKSFTNNESYFLAKWLRQWFGVISEF